jgi:hypothetical protein
VSIAHGHWSNLTRVKARNPIPRTTEDAVPGGMRRWGALCLACCLATVIACDGGGGPAPAPPPPGSAPLPADGSGASAPAGAAERAQPEPAGSDLTPEELAAKAEFLEVARRQEESASRFVGGSLVEDLRRELEDAVPGTPEEILRQEMLAAEHLRLGENLQALAGYQAALRAERALWESDTALGVVRPGSARQAERRAALLMRLVVSALMSGTQANDVARHTPVSSLVPIRADGIHVDPTGAETAVSYAPEYLELFPESPTAIWLLNLAAMQAGVHPEGVPERFRLSPERLRPEGDAGFFSNRAPGLRMDRFDRAGGSLAEDLDGDGDMDWLTTTMDPRGSPTFFRNNGDGSFTDVTHRARLAHQTGGTNVVQSDYDNDGRPDLFILRGGGLGEQGHIRNSLLHNDGDVTFSDVTGSAGLAEPALPSRAAGWADHDGDGDLDLYVGHEGELRGGEPVLHAGNLFRNNGDGTFTDVAVEAGVTNDLPAMGVAWGDYNGDGAPDLYVSNEGPNRLYRNDGDGTFTDVAGELGVLEPEGRSSATWFFDLDADGDLDLFVASQAASLDDMAADILGRLGRRPDLWPRLYRNDAGAFTDITAESGLARPGLVLGANFGDIDEDGFPDLYLGTGAPAHEALVPNRMYLNAGDGTFVDITFSGGFGHLRNGNGISFADFDNDGDADVALQAGGFYPGDGFQNALFENPGHGNRFLAVKAVGTVSNRAAIGARLRVRVDTPGGERSIYRWVGSGGSFGASPLEQLVGLGDARAILDLVVHWPSGKRQVFAEVPLDGFVVVTEGEESLRRQDRRRFRLDGS